VIHRRYSGDGNVAPAPCSVSALRPAGWAAPGAGSVAMKAMSVASAPKALS